MKTLLFTMALLLSVTSYSFAQSKVQDNSKSTENTTLVPVRQFVDANNDGVCDKFANRPDDGRGRNFTDKDNDGKCDNNPGTTGKNFRGQNRKGNGCCGNGNGFRHGRNQRGNGNCLRQNTQNPQK